MKRENNDTKVILVFCEDARYETHDPLAIQVVQDAVLRETMQTAVVAAQRWRILRDMFEQSRKVVGDATAA